MATLVRQPVWKNMYAGDIFRVVGVRARRYRFLAFVTNLDNGHTFVEAVEVDNPKLRAFRPDIEVVRDKRASRQAHARAAAHQGAGTAVLVQPPLFS